jgi:hypothetical protein
MADCSLQIVIDDIRNTSANSEMHALHTQFSFCGDQQLVTKNLILQCWVFQQPPYFGSVSLFCLFCWMRRCCRHCVHDKVRLQVVQQWHASQKWFFLLLNCESMNLLNWETWQYIILTNEFLARQIYLSSNSHKDRIALVCHDCTGWTKFFFLWIPKSDFRFFIQLFWMNAGWVGAR